MEVRAAAVAATAAMTAASEANVVDEREMAGALWVKRAAEARVGLMEVALALEARWAAAMVGEGREAGEAASMAALLAWRRCH